MATIAPVEISLDELWMPFTAEPGVQEARRGCWRRRKGMYYTDVDGNEILDGTRRALVRERGALPRADRGGDPEGGGDARLRAGLQHGASAAASSWPSRLAEHAAGRPRPRLLHQLGIGGGGHGAQDRDRLPRVARRERAHAIRRPAARATTAWASAASPSAGIETNRKRVRAAPAAARRRTSRTRTASPSNAFTQRAARARRRPRRRAGAARVPSTAATPSPR